MIRTSTTSILTITGVTILGGFIAYAAYFDYKRRNDASFRKRIRTQKKQVDKAIAENIEKAASLGANLPREVLMAIHEKANEEPVPTDPDERHQFFIGVVAAAERLAAEGPHNYLEAALYFYQALRVYPSPAELLLIYEKTVPEPVLAMVMELHKMDVSMFSKMGGSGMERDIDVNETTSKISKGPPSEGSSQEWDKVTDPGSAGASA